MIEDIAVEQCVWIIGAKRQIPPGMRRMTGKTVNGADPVIRRIDFARFQKIDKSLMVVTGGTIIEAPAIGIIDIIAGGMNGILPLPFSRQKITFLTVTGETIAQ